MLNDPKRKISKNVEEMNECIEVLMEESFGLTPRPFQRLVLSKILSMTHVIVNPTLFF